MKTLTFTQEFMEQKECSTPTYSTSEFSSPLPDKIKPTKLNSSPPTTSPPLTIQSLQAKFQPLRQAAHVKKQAWAAYHISLCHKLKALDKLEKMSKLGKEYLNAYLLTKSARYANYQTDQLKHTNFTLQKYLQTLASEIATEAQYLPTKKEDSQ